jgi:hypothetical protein
MHGAAEHSIPEWQEIPKANQRYVLLFSFAASLPHTLQYDMAGFNWASWIGSRNDVV